VIQAEGGTYSASWDQTIRCWAAQTSQVLQGHRQAVRCLVALPEGFASGSDDGTVALWRRSEANPYRVLEGHRGYVRALAYGEGVMVSASWDQTLRLWPLT